MGRGMKSTSREIYFPIVAAASGIWEEVVFKTL